MTGPPPNPTAGVLSLAKPIRTNNITCRLSFNRRYPSVCYYLHKTKKLPVYFVIIAVPKQIYSLLTGFGQQGRPFVFTIRSPAIHSAAFSTQRRRPSKYHSAPFPVLRIDDQQHREMRIATLQFAPILGDVEGNIRRANELLQNGKVLGGIGISVDVLKPEILILPELALTGMVCVNLSLWMSMLMFYEKVITSLRWRLSSHIWSPRGRAHQPLGHGTPLDATNVKCALGILKSRKRGQAKQMVRIASRRRTTTLFWWSTRTGKFCTTIARRFCTIQMRHGPQRVM